MFFKFLCDFRSYKTKHTKNTLKQLKNTLQQQGTTFEVMGDKIPRICINNISYPPTLKSNIVLNVLSIDSHKT